MRRGDRDRADGAAAIEKVVGYPPLCDMGDIQRREFHEALLDAKGFEDLPGKWQAAIVAEEQNRSESPRSTDVR